MDSWDIILNVMMLVDYMFLLCSWLQVIYNYSYDYYYLLFIIIVSLLGSVNHLLLVLNSSLNFLIYCCMAKRFRTALLNLFRSWRCYWQQNQNGEMEFSTPENTKMADVNRYNWNIYLRRCKHVFIVYALVYF